MLELRLQAKRGTTMLDVHLRASQPWTVLFGVSGSGKSSILRAIAGLWQPDGTSIILGGVPLSQTPTHRRRIALVSQQGALFPHMRVRENLRFVGATTSVPQLLEQFQASHLAGKKPQELSSGEQQRVALARAIASKPKLLLLDEGLSGLDLHLRSALISALKDWQQQSNAQILSVTHNLSETLECADEVALLEDGHITQTGPPREVLAERKDHLLRLLAD